jgi:dethiobiotin synthetase
MALELRHYCLRNTCTMKPIESVILDSHDDFVSKSDREQLCRETRARVYDAPVNPSSFSQLAPASQL